MLCAVTIPPADLRSLSSYYYTVCGRMCMSSVCVWCSCLLVICLKFFNIRFQAFMMGVQMIVLCVITLGWISSDVSDKPAAQS